MNVVECIPYKTFKERVRIVNEELKKDRHVEIYKDYIYSATKGDEN